jgi:hypothetical protein
MVKKSMSSKCQTTSQAMENLDVDVDISRAWETNTGYKKLQPRESVITN